MAPADVLWHFGWGYRRAAYRRMAERLGEDARQAYERVFAQEPKLVDGGKPVQELFG